MSNIGNVIVCIEREKEQKEYEHKLENSFGEPWESKKSRILSAWHKDGQTAEGKDRQNSSNPPRIDLRCFIVKSNDDLRQEVCCLQLMELFKEIFIDMGIPTSQLWLKPYQIVSTGIVMSEWWSIMLYIVLSAECMLLCDHRL